MLLLLACNAEALPLNDYIQSFLKNSESLMSQRAAVTQAESDLEIATDLWASSFQLSPTHRTSNQKLEAQSSSDVLDFNVENTGLQGGLNQAMPWGFNLEVSAFKNIMDTQDVFLGLDQQFTGTLSVDLLQNLGGGQDRVRIASAEKALEAEKLNYQDQALRQCHQAIQVYANAKYAIDRLRLFEAQFNSAKESYQIADRAYKQRIIRKIDMLSAKSDLVSAEAELATQQANTQQALDELFVQGGEAIQSQVQTGQTDDLKLESPDQFMALPAASADNWQGSRRAVAAKLVKESAERNLEATQMAQRAQVRAGVRADVQDSVTQFGQSNLFDQHNETVTVFLEMDWPWNRTNAARVRAAESSKVRADALALETEKNLRSEYLELTRQKSALAIQLRASVERQKVLKERMSNGLRLVRSGKLDFDEYIRYQNAYYLESSQQIELRSSLIQNQLGFFNFTEQPVGLCRGVI
ncbi:MAG: TolC family protein [Bdellovibrionales bacterium]|nr:TolC family protein [Bdellovibrionales bacterium]